MLSNKQNIAYDLSLFEPRDKDLEKRKNNVVAMPKGKLDKKRKTKPLAAIGALITPFMVLSIVAIMIYSQVQLTELTDKINAASLDLAEQQSVYTQLSMKAESKFSLRAVEEVSKERLHMRKSEPSQIKYIKLSQGDKAEITQSSKCDGIIENISRTISSLLS